jgi:hypothetical protein
MERTNGCYIVLAILLVLTITSYKVADKKSEEYFSKIYHLIETKQVISIIQEPTEEGFNFYIRTEDAIYEVTGEIYFKLKDSKIREE